MLFLGPVFVGILVCLDAVRSQNGISIIRKLELLFLHPNDPNSAVKDNVVFVLPPKLMTGSHEDPIIAIPESAIHVKVMDVDLPDLAFAKELGRGEQMTLFNPRHRRIASRLIDLFMSIPTREELLTIALYGRDNLNQALFFHCYSVTLMHRPDCRKVHVPPLVQVFPDAFLSKDAMTQVRKEMRMMEPSNKSHMISSIDVDIPEAHVGTTVSLEKRLDYFRHDLGLNLHHYHWHLVYPSLGNVSIIDKDRRGELFYHMHHQMMARYNSARLSNRLKRVVSLNFREPIIEGYFPNLDHLSTNLSWSARQPNTLLQSVRRPDYNVSIEDLEQWQAEIMLAITDGYGIMVDKKTNETILVPLDDVSGIDKLSAMIESSSLSMNIDRYGDFHNMVHVALAYCHDPVGKYEQPYGVVATFHTACRDPAFFRWHNLVDDLFIEHKMRLTPYNDTELGFPGVSFTDVKVMSTPSNITNELRTFWEKTYVEISNGLDFHKNNFSIKVRFTHLQHEPFTYKMRVNNNGNARKGTVRIFLAPKFDEVGRPMKFRDQRTLFVEMDRFVVDLANGLNTFTRSSEDSSVSRPIEDTFHNRTGEWSEYGKYVGCGWPNYMLLPKGRVEGMKFQLFLMVTDFAQDQVNPPGKDGEDNWGSILCGIPRGKYPDKRPMGFPFDRRGNDERTDFKLTDFMTANMHVNDVVIRFQEKGGDRVQKTEAIRATP